MSDKSKKASQNKPNDRLSSCTINPAKEISPALPIQKKQELVSFADIQCLSDLEQRLSSTPDNPNTLVKTGRYKDMKDRKVILHKVLKDLLKKNNLKPDALASELGIARSTFRSFLDDSKTKYDPINLEKLCSYFGVELSFLLYGGKRKSKVNINSLQSVTVFSGLARITVEKIIDQDDYEYGGDDE